MKFTTVTIKEIQADKTHRLDAGYWIKKKSRKLQAPSLKMNKVITYKWARPK